MQPSMWFLHDGTGYTQCCLADREQAWLFHVPHTGLDGCLGMILSCFRKRISDLNSMVQRVRRRDAGRVDSDDGYAEMRIATIEGDTSPGGLGWVDFDLGSSKAGGPLL